MNNPAPLCAVFMITYNQEAFIEQAIESVMQQKASFPFKLIIGEDCSSDRTPGICRKMEARYPGGIIAHTNETNKGPMQNALQVYHACVASGAKYVAMIEGDDYWDDEQKLQKQVAFLEANPGYAICFHETIALKEDGTRKPMLGIDENRTFVLDDLLQRNFIPTVSAVFRVYDFLGKLDTGFSKLFAGDWAIHLENASCGKIYYMPDTMAVYRIHAGGIWSAMKPAKAVRKYIELMDELNGYFSYRYDTAFRNAKNKILQDYENGVSFLAPGGLTFFGRVKGKLRRMFRGSEW